MFAYIMPVLFNKTETKRKLKRPASRDGVQYEMKQRTVSTWKPHHYRDPLDTYLFGPGEKQVNIP